MFNSAKDFFIKDIKFNITKDSEAENTTSKYF